jgi:hypothetical protein
MSRDMEVIDERRIVPPGANKGVRICREEEVEIRDRRTRGKRRSEIDRLQRRIDRVGIALIVDPAKVADRVDRCSVDGEVQEKIVEQRWRRERDVVDVDTPRRARVTRERFTRLVDEVELYPGGVRAVGVIVLVTVRPRTSFDAPSVTFTAPLPPGKLVPVTE